jgi:hypothetical protein
MLRWRAYEAELEPLQRRLHLITEQYEARLATLVQRRAAAAANNEAGRDYWMGKDVALKEEL